MPEKSSPSSPRDLIGWRHFPHVADVGVIGYGPTAELAFEQAALGMSAVITAEPIDLPDYALIFCEAQSIEDLFFAWLNAVTYEMAVRRMIFGAFVVCISGRKLCGAAYGEPIDQKKHQPACEVKGPTYTELKVLQGDDGVWTAQCVIDV